MATRSARAKSTPPADDTPETVETTEAQEPTNGAPVAGPVDFLKLLEVAEDDTKASRKSDERTDIHVPEEWISKVKHTFENRKRVHIPGIHDKDTFAAVGDLIRAAADRIDKSATVRAKYTLPDGAEDKPENRVLSGLTFTVGPRRKGPQGKKAADAAPETADESGTVDADSASSGD